MTRPDIIDTVSQSGLKGRGGAGFPTGMKWNFCAAEKGDLKYIICNADEGEPGTFKDRVILSRFADLVFEGMTIGGARHRRDARHRLPAGRVHLPAPAPQRGHQGAPRRGVLGRAIMGVDGFDFDIIVAMGAGAYVCGEETALIESLEGFRGEPRNRPPFPVVAGLLNNPTVVNNVETLASVAAIFAKGTEWFKGFGTDKSTGYKLFSISGDCEKPGVYEFPWGITIADLLKEVGGEGAKAVQIGGASGVCVPARDFGRRLAFEDIPTGGSVMVIGPQRDILDVAENFLEFFVEESCGQCTPCRLGNPQMLRAVELLKEGACPPKFLADVKALGETMKVASKCGLGQTSPSAFLSILEGFERRDPRPRPERVTRGVSMSHPTTPIHRAPLSQQHRRVITTTSPDAIGALVSVTIDGVEAKVPFGTTILEAARAAGVNDPDPLRPPRPRRGRRVPHVRRRGRGPAHCCSRPAPSRSSTR